MRKIALILLIAIMAGVASGQTANETLSALEDAKTDIQEMKEEEIPTERVENLLETANNSYRAQKNFEDEGGTADYSRAMELTEQIEEIREQALQASDRIEALENRLSELEGTSVNLTESRSHLDSARTDFQEQRFEEVGSDIDSSYSAISEAQSAQTQIESFAAAQREGIQSWIDSGLESIRENPLRISGGFAASLLILWLSLREIITYRLLKVRRRKEIKREVLEDLIEEVQKDYYMKKEGSPTRFETKHEKFEELRRDTVQDIDVLEEKLKNRWSLLMNPEEDIQVEEKEENPEDIEFMDKEDKEISGAQESGSGKPAEEETTEESEASEKESENIEKESDEPDKEFKCSECGRKFGTKRGLHIHQTQTHEDGGYTCDKCGDEFDTKRGLHIHEGMKHDNADGVECPECGRTFDTEKGMHIHRGEVHKD